jgi:hypothetical protein
MVAKNSTDDVGFVKAYIGMDSLDGFVKFYQRKNSRGHHSDNHNVVFCVFGLLEKSEEFLGGNILALRFSDGIVKAMGEFNPIVKISLLLFIKLVIFILLVLTTLFFILLILIFFLFFCLELPYFFK